MKDFARILALFESGSASPDEIGALAERHQLVEAWKRFKTRFIDE